MVPVNHSKGRIRFVNIRGEYKAPNYKHVRLTVDTPTGEHNWEIHESFSEDFLDLRTGDEIEIVYDPAPPKGNSAYRIFNSRTRTMYNAGYASSGCMFVAVFIGVLPVIALAMLRLS